MILASMSSKISLKRRRPNVVENHAVVNSSRPGIDYSIRVRRARSDTNSGDDCKHSSRERGAWGVFQSADELHYPRFAYPLNENCNKNHSRLFQKRFFFFQAVIISFTIFFSSSLGFRFVSAELQPRQFHRDEISSFDNRSNLNRVWKKGEQQWNHTILKNCLEGVECCEEGQTGCTKKGRELAGEALERVIRQQNVTGDIEEKLPPALRSDISADSSNSGISPYESNVSSPPANKPQIDFSDSFKKNNPLIQNILPINFEVELLVKDTMTNELLKGLEVTLENYLRTEYQKLIDGGKSQNENPDGASNFASKTLKLGGIDLTLSLVESKWWQERHLRRLGYSSGSSVKGSVRSLEQNRQSSEIKLISISVDGSATYSMEVDGSVPTPDDIEKQWSEAYVDMTSQDRLERAIEDADIEGVIRLEKVTMKDSTDQAENSLSIDTIEDTNGSIGNESYSDTTSNENVASLYENSIDKNKSGSSGNASSVNFDEMNSSESSSQLKRPSMLSIIFGFVLTGIAVLGLFVYAYLFYRKRQKKLKKKRKMKESITFSSASAGVTTAAFASKRDHSIQYYPKTTKQPTSNSVEAPRSSQIHSNSMMILSQAESEETSYKGIESSVGSEDITDSFANELKLAASVDQEAWNESQRIKKRIEKREANRLVSTNTTVNKNSNFPINTTVPSLLSNGRMSLEENEIDEVPSSWVKSFPYGDEPQGVRGISDKQTVTPSSFNQWEPYNSLMPPLVEEKKDEASPSEFFARKLKNLENDLTESGKQQTDTTRVKDNVTNDSGSTSDILSEVSELSKYVQRYKRRKDRKMKRGEHLHERLGVGAGVPSYSSAPKTMSIGMDGRVYKAHQSDDFDKSSSSLTKRLGPNHLSTYAESYREAQQHETSVLESFSFVSEEENDAEEPNSMSQRLGISPYRRSKDELYYKNGGLRNEDNSTSGRSPTSPSRTKSTRMEDDYRYSVGYSNKDYSKSSSSRLADLRANDAIIDHSNSEVNVNYGVPSTSKNAINVRKSSFQDGKKESNTASRNFQRLDKSEKNEAPISVATSQQTNKPNNRPTNNNRFDKLRGMFERNTNDRPEPIYPPGENWQNGGSLGR